MGGVNKIILVGNLGRDPELRVGQSGASFCRFSLAVTEKYNGEDRTEWFNCVAFSKLAEVVSKYLKKGRQVYVEGRLQTRKYQDKAGQDRQATEVIVGNLTMLGGGEKRSTGNTGATSTSQAPARPVPHEQNPFDDPGPPAEGDPPW